MIYQAGENLIMLLGADMEDTRQDDIQYIIDLGLIKKSSSGLRISNAIWNQDELDKGEECLY